MPRLIRDYDNNNRAIVEGGELPLVHFNRVRLGAGEHFEQVLAAHESVVVVQSGTIDVTVDNERFADIGIRKDIWSGRADSVYAPLGARVWLTSTGGAAEIVIAGGVASRRTAPFRIPPEEVSVVDVGSAATHSHRRIFHILGQNGADRADRLLVSELYADDGCWSGYPPHKHDTDRGAEETAHDELYHYRYTPESGFGAQLAYGEADGDQCFLVRNGDTVLVDRGYHPTVTSPGHRGYIFTVLVGRTRRGLVQYFDPRHGDLMTAIPGIQAMRDKFR